MKNHFIVIFVTVLAAMISIATFNPILGPLARSLGLTEIQSGSLVTITGICWIVGSFVWARWARAGRKRIMISALAGYAVTLVAFAYIADTASASAGHLYWIFLALRAVAGFFFGAIPAMAQGYLMDWTSAENRANGMALFGAANGLGFVLGPAMGAALVSVGLTAPMYVSGVLLAAVILLFGIRIPGQQTVSVQEKAAKLSPWDYRIRLYIGIGLTLSVVMVILQVTAGFYMQDRLAASAQGAARMIGLALTIAGVIVVAVQVLNTRFLKWKPGTMLKIGLCALALGFFWFMAAPSYYAAAFAVFGIGIGFTLPGYTAAASLAVSEHEQSGVASFAAAVQGVGSFVGPIAGTVLYSFQTYLPYVLCICLVALFIPFVAAKTKRAHAAV